MEQVLLFDLGGEAYGLEISLVREVLAAPRLYPIPRAPAALLGALNVHGRIVPLLDLGAWLGFAPAPLDARVIVLSVAAGRLALAVHQVRRIAQPAGEPLPPAEGAEQGCIRAVIHHGERMVSLLDVARLMESLDNLAAL
ncbi:chemotaxis protein CheW [Geoalkalibacter sp.]|uniref:chemotaxis protein CheW n=1 Tax=Geoalkalibacter sp. TaxID=3041440 RepID=UPI00272DE059|nr:chemotaxis protein CheW [Geoalkalibacter sp.]